MMVVSCEPTISKDGERWNVKALEDHAATACAVQNFMLSIASEGYGGLKGSATLLKVILVTDIAPENLRRLKVDDWEDGHFGREDFL